jgi:hypothetical protein
MEPSIWTNMTEHIWGKKTHCHWKAFRVTQKMYCKPNGETLLPRNEHINHFQQLIDIGCHTVQCSTLHATVSQTSTSQTLHNNGKIPHPTHTHSTDYLRVLVEHALLKWLISTNKTRRAVLDLGHTQLKAACAISGAFALQPKTPQLAT